MARPSNTEARRVEIVDGLRKLMARRGYDGASVAEIARAAGLAPGLVHYHFDDKREILLALVATLAREAGERADRAVQRAGASPLERLEAYLDAFLSLERDPDPEAVACWVAIAAEAIRDPKVRRAFASALADTGAVLERLVAEASPGSRGAKASAAALLASMQGYFLLSASAPELIPPGSAASVSRRIARALVSGGGA